MATAVNPVGAAGINLGSELNEIARQLRTITVRVSGAGPGIGSGMIWRSDGLVITNAHVARSRQQRIELADGAAFNGWLIARDERSDLAAMMIEARGLSIPELRQAATLRPGEVVIAVGNPMGAAGALSTGIVHCAPVRLPWIFADVRLAPGNSGGPLADAQGRVVGINSMVVDGFGCAVACERIVEFLRSMERGVA